jgi:hypothetical protein
MSLGVIVDESLRQYLDQSGEVAQVLARLDRLGRSIDHLKRDLELLSEFQGVFVRIWFAHTPPIAESEKELAQRQGAKRFEQMLDFVSRRIQTGHRFGKEVTRDGAADERERTEVASRGADGDRRGSQ